MTAASETVTQTTPAAEPFYTDPHVWVAVAFVLFAIVFIKYILPSINGALDRRSAEIANQLAQANTLRAEAEMLMAASKERQQAMMKEAEAMVEQAKIDAKEIIAKAEADLAQTIIRRTAMADEKMARAQENAIQEMRGKMVEAATEIARNVIAEQMKTQEKDPAIALAIQAIERKFH